MTSQWEGPQPTPDRIGIDTPLHYLNESWKIAIRLLDKGRRLYKEGKGLGTLPDQPGGYPGAWLPVSLGRRAPLVYPWADRDMGHGPKLMSYLWSDEHGLLQEFEKNLLMEQVSPKGYFRHQNYTDRPLPHIGQLGIVSPYANHMGNFAIIASDLVRYNGITSSKQQKIFPLVATMVKRILETFDPEGSGLTNVGVEKEWHSRCFWGTFLGEPNHYPPNYDGRNKVVIGSMALAVFLKRFQEAAIAADMPEQKYFGTVLERLVNAIEGPAWNDNAQYYYLQRDQNSDRWFMSMNGICEDSRETDVVPYYAAEAGEIPERVRAVGRVINQVILKENIFPMPTRYPTYSWYSPQNPNGIDMGEDCGQIGGAWDTPYFHCVEILSRLGLQEAVQRAIFRRAEVTYRDQDCLESYRIDGTVDNTRFFNRDEYIVSATAHLSSIIEGLFGITPARMGFAEVNIHPNLPLYRRYRHTSHPSEWSGRNNRISVNLGLRGCLELTLRYDEDAEVLTMHTSAVGIPAHIRLPLDFGGRFKRAYWSNKPIKARIEHGMDSDFIHVDHRLDGGNLRIELDPHPQKGKGSTPYINPEKS